jgi:hypothetical protein
VCGFRVLSWCPLSGQCLIPAHLISSHPFLHRHHCSHSPRPQDEEEEEEDELSEGQDEPSSDDEEDRRALTKRTANRTAGAGASSSAFASRTPALGPLPTGKTVSYDPVEIPMGDKSVIEKLDKSIYHASVRGRCLSQGKGGQVREMRERFRLAL